ncbi:MAG: hypothetical protein RLZZ616_141, partial [Pseudomonadota bacterium]
FDQIKTRSVRELVGLFAHCQLFVGNDTGPRHMAQAIDLPLLTIVAPGGDKIIANPVNHPRYQAIDIFDAKGPAFQLPQNAEKDFIDDTLLRAITPELVIARLTALPDWQATTA